MREGDRSGRLRFGVFEVDLRTGDLTKRGSRLRLQEQPFRDETLDGRTVLSAAGPGPRDDGWLRTGRRRLASHALALATLASLTPNVPSLVIR
jgi:hypothetical protein